MFIKLYLQICMLMSDWIIMVHSRLKWHTQILHWETDQDSLWNFWLIITYFHVIIMGNIFWASKNWLFSVNKPLYSNSLFHHLCMWVIAFINFLLNLITNYQIMFHNTTIIINHLGARYVHFSHFSFLSSHCLINLSTYPIKIKSCCVFELLCHHPLT